MFGAIESGKSESAKFAEQWEKTIKKVVPKDRLLVFEVKQGWKPLCQFLDLPEPTVPFPRANDRAEMIRNIDKIRKIGWVVVLGTPVILATIVYGLCWILNFV